jgi:hypothetical protein
MAQRAHRREIDTNCSGRFWGSELGKMLMARDQSPVMNIIGTGVQATGRMLRLLGGAWGQINSQLGADDREISRQRAALTGSSSEPAGALPAPPP